MLMIPIFNRILSLSLEAMHQPDTLNTFQLKLKNEISFKLHYPVYLPVNLEIQLFPYKSLGDQRRKCK